jgi:hypothetical protein
MSECDITYHMTLISIDDAERLPHRATAVPGNPTTRGGTERSKRSMMMMSRLGAQTLFKVKARFGSVCVLVGGSDKFIPCRNGRVGG